jgi:methionine sulfoxide reductase heme-binding subunit
VAVPSPVAQQINGWLKPVPAWPLYAFGALYMAWLFWQALNGVSVEPIDWLERAYGITALKFLVATLAVTPLRRFAGVNLLKFRRALGLLVFFFVLAHFLVWALLDVQALGAVWADIVKRPYITIGMGAFLMLIPLALTSNNASVRRLGGAGWRRLHRLTYPIAVLGALHYIWLARGFALEPLVYMALILGLLATRLPVRRMVPA